MQLLKFIVGIFITSVAFGADLPDWVNSTPEQDSLYKYYVGRSEPLSTEAAAYISADKNARAQAIKDNFGSEFQISTVSSDNLDGATSNSRIHEASDMVKLSGFETIKDKLITSDNQGVKKFTRYILYKYSKKNIELEKIRLAKLASSNPVFNITGNQSDCKIKSKTDLVITANVPKAKVLVNGEVLGLTPLKVFCFELNDPNLTVQIDHALYETYEEVIPARIGQDTKLNVHLIKAQVILKLDSNPTGARAFLDGNDLGSTPLENIKVAAGESHKFSFQHPETEKFSQELVFNKESAHEEIVVPLPFKASYLSVTSKQSGAIVFLDGEEIGKTPLKKIKCAIGNHALEVVKSGFNSFTTNFSCSAGQSTVLPIIDLNKRNLNAVSIDVQYFSSSAPIKNMGFALSGLELNFSKFIVNNIGIRAGIGIISREKESDDSILDIQGSTVNLGLPFYYFYDLKEKNWIELAPEITATVFRVKDKKNTSAGTKEFKVRSNGVRIGVKFKDYFILKAGYYINGTEMPNEPQNNYKISFGGVWDI